MLMIRTDVLTLVLFWLTTSSHCYFLLQGIAPQDIVAVHRRQSEQIPRHLPEIVSEPEPSCAELRAMWRHMNRMARHSEITNEIPQYSDLYGYMLTPPIKQSYRQNNNKYYQPFVGSEFGTIVRQPNRDQGRISRSRTRSSERSRSKSGRYSAFDDSRGNRARLSIPGRFNDVAMPKDTLGLYGTIVHSPDEKALVERQQLMREEAKHLAFADSSDIQDMIPSDSSSRVSNDIGTFGSFAVNEDNDFKSKYKYGNAASNIGASSIRDPEFAVIPDIEDSFVFRAKSVARQKASCKRLEGKICKRRDDCFCSRNQLQCVAGTCRRINSVNKVFTDEWGSWHGGPLDSSALGISRLKRETTRTIVM